jgi:hypothetical protein
MAYQRVPSSFSWNPPDSQKTSPFAPRPFGTPVGAGENAEEPSLEQQVERAERFGHNFATLSPGQAPIQRMMGLRRRRGFQLEENRPAPPAAQPQPRPLARAAAPPPTSLLSTARTAGTGITGVSSGLGMLNRATGIGGGLAGTLAPIAAPISSALSLVQAPETASAAADAFRDGNTTTGTRRAVQSIAQGVGGLATGAAVLAPFTAPVTAPIAAAAGAVSTVLGAPESVQSAQQGIQALPGQTARARQGLVSLLPDSVQAGARTLSKSLFDEQD